MSIQQQKGDPYLFRFRGERTPRFTDSIGIGGGVRIHFVGRLATYKYYNMDQVVAQR